MFAQMPELSRSAANLAIEFMGCSAIAKAVETASWYLTAHPNKLVLVSFMDSITPLSPVLSGKYAHFTEIEPKDRQKTVDAMHGFLFGDATVAMLLGADGPGPKFGPISHWTNDLAEDTELGTVPDGGSDIPVVYGRRKYTLSPDFKPRGTFYATHTVKQLLEGGSTRLKRAKDATMLLMHTGSCRILDGLCAEFGVSPSSVAAESSYRILRKYGNTIGCSVPLMLADPVERPEGEGLMVAFGLSFSCGACTMTIPAGGWRP
jgi:3-oxoacyl-[acyl-carrier-protein] synthase-3